MRALVDDLLDVAKMETSEVSVALAPTALKSLLEESVSLWRGEAGAKGLDLIVDLADAPSWIETDGGRVRQIVHNLLSNAIKFTPAGTVRLSARRSAGDDFVEIVVTDSGVGIPKDQLDIIFDAFYQIDCGTARQFSGTGLGLAICRNLAEALGGTISVESQGQGGSSFSVRLPAREVAQIVARPCIAPLALAQARVAVLESNPLKQAMLLSLIEPHAARVSAIGDFASALTAVNDFACDHLIVDVRSVADDQDEPLVLLHKLADSANASGLQTTYLFSAGGSLTLKRVASTSPSNLLQKPISGPDLITALNNLYSFNEAPLRRSQTPHDPGHNPHIQTSASRRKGAIMKVLFVEDDAMNRRVLKDMLSVVGANMEEAADAETGLRMIDERFYDIVDGHPHARHGWTDRNPTPSAEAGSERRRSSNPNHRRCPG